MSGRSCAALLALFLLLLARSPARAQSGGVSQPGQAFPIRTRPEVNLDPFSAKSPRQPAPHFRRRVLPLGPFGFVQLTQAAGIIFSGTVTEITRWPGNTAQNLQTVRITFHVENAIRGATAGDTLTISQWIGLWSGGQRYRVGERVMLFLYPPSKLGLTSCVGGAIGRFPVDAGGRVLLSSQQLSVFRKDPVLGGKSRVRLSDFAWAVRQASEEE